MLDGGNRWAERRLQNHQPPSADRTENATLYTIGYLSRFFLRFIALIVYNDSHEFICRASAFSARLRKIGFISETARDIAERASYLPTFCGVTLGKAERY